MANTIERFWSKVDVRQSDECWEWLTGKDRDGYGVFWDGKYTRANRFAYQLYYGDLNDEDRVCHTCDNPSCVNHRHLWKGTDTENIQDRDVKGRQARGETSGMSKLTTEQIHQIRNDGRPYREIAVDYGMGKSQIGNIKNNVSWEHV